MHKRLWLGAGALAAVIVVVVAAVALSGGGDRSEVVDTTEPAPATTAASPPATAVPLPETTAPAVAFSSSGEVPELEALVESLYRLAAGEDVVPPPMTPWVEEALAGTSATEPLTIAAQTHWAPLRYGQQVAVVTADEDVILAAEDAPGLGWTIVGVDLPRFGVPATYGPPVRSVLVLGSDARWNQDALGQRADSIHIVTAVAARQAGAIVGIPRDSWVAGPSGGRGKINGFLTTHGPEGMVATVESVSGIDVEGYIITGFLGFEIMMRNFGPLPIDLPNRVRGGLPGFPNFSEGAQEIGAENLLLLARIRKTLPNGDFTRSENHGIIMKAGLAEVQRRGMAELPSLIQILEESSWTDLPASALLTLGATAFELDPALVDNRVIPGSVGTTSGGASIVNVGSGAAALFADQADDGLLEPDG